ncbi:MAG TPA: type I 3-dehydroquinate dehydratase [Planctomycetes bacterium]|nr:type I 3-dehydroquinate dehydratase [Planctomycetota bacterium]HIN79612.1 type I 3-dehydroquinate dehydratase [Planctomycetota bacterium]
MTDRTLWQSARGWITSLSSRDDRERWLNRPIERQSAIGCELRIDLLSPTEGNSIEIRDSRVQIIACRQGASSEAQSMYADFARGNRGAALLDIDGEGPFADIRATEVSFIRSWHLDRPFEDQQVEEKIAVATAEGAALAKIVLCEDGMVAVRQARRIFRIPRKIPLLIFSAGKSGTASRILAVADGQRWGYGRILKSPGSAEGQVATATAAGRYGTLEKSPESLLAVVGKDVHRSLSPGFHNRVIGQTGANRLFLDISTADPDSLLDSDPDVTFGALAVTQPHKRWARLNARPADEMAGVYPAFNTLWRDQSGDWIGTNTDGPAVASIIEERKIPAQAPILILGGGATATAIAIALGRGGRRPSLLAREPLEGAYRDALADSADPVGEQAIASASVLINATGAGGGQNRLPWPVERFRGELAIEIASGSETTDFLRDATSNGATGIPASVMFSEQARRQCPYFHGIDVSSQLAASITAEALADLTADEGEWAQPDLTH